MWSWAKQDVRAGAKEVRNSHIFACIFNAHVVPSVKE